MLKSHLLYCTLLLQSFQASLNPLLSDIMSGSNKAPPSPEFLSPKQECEVLKKMLLEDTFNSPCFRGTDRWGTGSDIGATRSADCLQRMFALTLFEKSNCGNLQFKKPK